MDAHRLEEAVEYMDAQLAASPARAAVLWSDADTGKVLYAHDPEVRVASASTIKTPLMLTLLEGVRTGALALDQAVPVPREAVLADTRVFELGRDAYPLGELIYWMITESDNTATNLLIPLAGMDAVNTYCQGVLGCRNTTLGRRMLDFDAAKTGRDNYTSARDMESVFVHLYRQDILTPALCGWALDILRRQRWSDQFLRYIPDDLRPAHKTGTLSHLSHDCGLFWLPRGAYYLGVFLWDTPDAGGDKRLVGRIAKAAWDACRG